MSMLLALGAVVLTDLLPQRRQILAYDPTVLAADSCLAPDFEGPACVTQRTLGPNQGAPTASAALLAPDSAPASELELDEAALRPGDEVTYWCGEPECRPARRIVVPAG